MKSKLAFLIAGLILGATISMTSTVIADSGDRSTEYILNRVYDSATATLKITVS